MRLKVNNEDATLFCGVSRCYSTPYIIDASGKRFDDPTSLCRRHWFMICDEEEKVFLRGRCDEIDPPEIKEV